MRTITAVENLSLDGVMQSPASPEEDPRGGFIAGGWAAGPLSADPAAAQASFAGAGAVTAMLFGRRTYDHLLGYWLSVPDPNPFAEDPVRLVDELVLTVLPVVVGSGTRLFGDTALRLQVGRHDAFPSGITVPRWVVAR
jgi:dihydrofolate reductase